MQVNVKYFAALRECVGQNSEIINIESHKLEDLFNHLNEKYNFPISRDHLKVAVNEEYADFSDSYKDGDIVVFIPPVAGG